jgi:putative nucleotidyltransferase with HDIG domain
MQPQEAARHVKRITDSLITLPTLPTVVARMLDLVDNPKTSTVTLARLIAQDQVLTARILKLANSSFYAFPRRIGTVQLALVVLGFDAVKEMALGLSVLGAFRDESKSEHFHIARFWQHSVAVGAATRLLARKLGHRQVGEAFVAGLLHDIGKLVLNQYLPKEFATCLSAVNLQGKPPAEAEMALFGTTHGEVGGWLAERWNLPLALVEAIRHHHFPTQSKDSPELPTLVGLGDYLAHRCQLGASGVPMPTTLPTPLVEQAEALFRLKSTDLEAWVPEVFAETDRASSFLPESD